MHLLVNELYIYPNARCNDKKWSNVLEIFDVNPVKVKLHFLEKFVYASHSTACVDCSFNLICFSQNSLSNFVTVCLAQ